MIKLPKTYLLLFLVFSKLYLISQSPTFTFNINGAVPSGFQNGLITAGLKWSQHLKIDVPIKVNVYTVNSAFFPFSGITFANGRQNFSKAPHSNFMYVTALANQIAGVETNPGEYDMDIYFNLATPFYFGNGKPNSGELDFITTAMHEIGHGLGFYSAGYVDASNLGSFGNIPASAISPATTSFPWKGQDGAPTIYDKYLVKKSHNSLVNCAALNSTALADSINNGPLYFNGQLFANATNSNSPIEVAGGNGAFNLGQDLLHLATSFKSTIMSYGWGVGDTVRIPTIKELGILREIGWNLTKPVGLKEVNGNSSPVKLFPNPSSNFITLTGEEIKSVKIYNGTGVLVKTEINSPGTAQFDLSLTDLPPGIYLAEIMTGSRKTKTTKRIIKE